MSQLPNRALLPVPLPANVIPFPGKRTLDSLMLLFRDMEDTVVVLSQDTRSAAPYDKAIAEGALTYEGDDVSYPRLLPLAQTEVDVLRRLDHLARDWQAAVTANNRDDLVRIVGSLRAFQRPDWLEIEFVMPPRARAA